MASLLISPRKRERPAASKRPPLLPWEEALRSHRIPVILPPQTPAAEREDPALDDLETKVLRDAVFPSRAIDIDGLYEAQVRFACVCGVSRIGAARCLPRSLRYIHGHD